jgi:hypothetical protein
MVGKYPTTLAGDQRRRVVNFRLSLPPLPGQFSIITPTTSNETIDVEFGCVINIKKILEEWGSDNKILYFRQYQEEAKHVNSQYEGTTEILNFNSNPQVIARLLANPNDLDYKTVKSIINHTIKFKGGIEAELFDAAMHIYGEKKYYIYDCLEDHEKTDNVELSIKNHLREEYEEFKANEDEYSRQIYDSMSSYPSEEE